VKLVDYFMRLQKRTRTAWSTDGVRKHQDNPPPDAPRIGRVARRDIRRYRFGRTCKGAAASCSDCSALQMC
jgi:hypothetical protein